jgi:predicted nucleic-acid-binding protein
MFALDTNVLVRWATNDDAAQVRLASDTLAGQKAWVGATVTLETEWVLRARYGAPREEIAQFFDALIDSPVFEVEDAEAVHAAFSQYVHGADFADALHYARRPKGTTLLTFDKTFGEAEVRRSKTVKIMKVSK